MENSKLSAGSFLKRLSHKKYLKNRELFQIGEMKVCKKDFEIENLDIIEPKNSYRLKKIQGNSKTNKEFSVENLKEVLENVSSCQISDAFSKLTGKNGVLENIKSVNNETAYGRVFTLETSSDDWGTSLLGIDEAKKGNILFIKTNGPTSAIWGGLTSSYSHAKGLAGTVICGATRDIDFIENFKYPVFAKEIVPNAGNSLGLGNTNIPIKIETSTEITIRTGDFIFGDKNGVIHIPQELFCEVILKTLEIKINEAKLISEIKKEKSLSEIIGLK